jgi:hypothetical protein
MAATYTDALLVYNGGKVQKIKSDNEIAVTLFDVLSTFKVGSSNELSVTNTTISRTNADIAIDPGTGNKITTNGGLQVGKTLNVLGNANIQGNLEVQGTLITTNRTSISLQDSFIDLNTGNTSTNAKIGGFTVNVNAVNSTSATIDSFTAGSSDNSTPPTITLTATTTLVQHDIIQITGSSVESNNGLYGVYGVDQNDDKVVFLYGIGGTAVPGYAAFLENQVTSSTDNATLSKIALSVLAVSDGSIYLDNGSTAIEVGKLAYRYLSPATVTGFANNWVKLDTVTQTLEAAYTGGATIQLTNGKALTVSAPTGGSTAGISLGANAASNFSVTDANLTLTTLNSGSLNLTSAATAALSGTSVNITGSASSKFEVTGAALNLTTLTSGAITISSASGASLNATGTIGIGDTNGSAVTIGRKSGGATTTVQANGTLLVDGSAAVNVVGAAASKFEVTGAALNLTTLANGPSVGNVALTSSANVVLTAATAGKVNSASEFVFDKAAGIEAQMANNVTVGEVGYFDSSGIFQESSSTTEQALEVDGVALESNESGSTQTRRIATIHGSKVAVAFVSGETPSGGEVVYLSATAGKATKNVPTTGRVFRLGKALGSTSGGLYNILWKPEYITDLS